MKKVKKEKKGKDRSGRNEEYLLQELPAFAPEALFKTQDYKLSDDLKELASQIKDRCLQFLETVSADEFNGTFYDPIISGECDRARIYLEKQRAEHEEASIKMIERYQTGSRIKYQNRLEQSRKELDEVERELAQLESIINKGTVYEEECI